MIIMASQPFLAARPRQASQCLLCNEEIADDEKKQSIGKSGLNTIRANADRWAAIRVPECDKPYHEFSFVNERITTKCGETLEAHPTCRVKFRNHLERKEKEHGQQHSTAVEMDKDIMLDEPTTAENSSRQNRRLSSRNVELMKSNFLCFICNAKTLKDKNPYSEGGLGRCSEYRAFEKLSLKMKMLGPGDKYEEAAKRLNLLLSGQAFDVFAVDVYYHKTCYTDFTRPTKCSKEEQLNNDETRLNVLRDKVRNEFLKLIERKVIKDKEAYLAKDLLDEFQVLSAENGLNADQSSIKYTYQLRQELQERFGETISFYKSGRNLIIHPTSVNPCYYALATLRGAGLRDDDLTRAFASMLRRKLTREAAQEWPISAEDLITKLDHSGPLDVI